MVQKTSKVTFLNSQKNLRDQKFSVEFVWTLGVLQYLIFEGEKTELTSAAVAEVSVRWF